VRLGIKAAQSKAAHAVESKAVVRIEGAAGVLSLFLFLDWAALYLTSLVGN
jgi:hypothetical protein